MAASRYAVSCLMTLTMSSKMTAPMVAVTIAPTNAAAKGGAQPQLRKQHAGNQGTDDADENIAEQAEAGPLHQQAGKPASDRANDQGYEQSCEHDFPHVKDLMASI